MNNFFISLALHILELYALFKINILLPIIGFYYINVHPYFYFIRVFFNIEYNVENIKDNEIVSTSLIDLNYENKFKGKIDKNIIDFSIFCDIKNNVKINFIEHFTKENNLCEIADVSFFTFSLTFDEIDYDITLNKPHNYIICGNKLNKLFFKWYMKTNHNITLNNDYKIKFIDNTFKENILTPDDDIIFLKNKINVENNNKKNI